MGIAAGAGMVARHRQQIAARIRGLISGQDDGNLSVTAARLHVDVTSLHLSTDDIAPYPTLDIESSV